MLTCSFSMPGLRPTLDICTLERDGAIGAVAGLWKPKERRPTEIILTVRLSHVDEREGVLEGDLSGRRKRKGRLQRCNREEQEACPAYTLQ